MSDLSQRSTTDFGLKQSAEDARDRRWESTFFMINVIFLLILFFIVAANFDVHLQVTPPKSAASNTLPATAPQLVVKPDGSMVMNGEEVASAQLAAALKRAGAAQDLKIAADAAVDAVVIARLIEQLGELGITRVAIETLSRPPDAQGS